MAILILEVSSNIGIGQTVAKTFRNNQQQFFDLLNRMSLGQPESIDGIEGLTASQYTSPKEKKVNLVGCRNDFSFCVDDWC